MTPDQITLALALRRAAMLPGSNTKRFARDMHDLATGPNASTQELTPRQAEYLRTAVIRHRRTIDPKVVELAHSLEQQDPKP